MKWKDYKTDIRNLSVKDLQAKIVELKKELFNLRFQHSIGELAQTANLKNTRKKIAIAMTILNEKLREEKDGKR
jgi:large subunit ribosomal protein L29